MFNIHLAFQIFHRQHQLLILVKLNMKTTICKPKINILKANRLTLNLTIEVFNSFRTSISMSRSKPSKFKETNTRNFLKTGKLLRKNKMRELNMSKLRIYVKTNISQISSWHPYVLSTWILVNANLAKDAILSTTRKNLHIRNWLIKISSVKVLSSLTRDISGCRMDQEMLKSSGLILLFGILTNIKRDGESKGDSSASTISTLLNLSPRTRLINKRKNVFISELD